MTPSFTYDHPWFTGLIIVGAAALGGLAGVGWAYLLPSATPWPAGLLLGAGGVWAGAAVGVGVWAAVGRRYRAARS